MSILNNFILNNLTFKKKKKTLPMLSKGFQHSALTPLSAISPMLTLSSRLKGKKKSSPNDSKSIPGSLVKEPLVLGDNESACYL